MQIFITSLNQIRNNSNLISEYLKLLPQDEQAYFNQVNSPKRQIQFLIGRVLLRTSLSDILAIPPSDILLTKTESGKLELADKSFKLHFNISHSNNMVAVAIDKAVVGLDIEFMKPRDFDQLATTAFSEVNSQSIKQLDGKAKKELFYTYWTQKEAAIKYGQAGEYNFTSLKYENDYMLSVAHEGDVDLEKLIITHRHPRN
jgi:4'-phosphopantetheinyl transferase